MGCCRAIVVVSYVVGFSSCERGECRRCGLSEQRNNNCRFELAFSRSFFLRRIVSLLNFDHRQSTVASLASWRSSIFERKRRRCARARRGRLFFFVCVCLALGAARSCGGALLMMACAPCSALCARLDAVCAARHCVRFTQYFLHHYSDTRCISLPCK